MRRFKSYRLRFVEVPWVTGVLVIVPMPRSEASNHCNMSARAMVASQIPNLMLTGFDS